MTIKLKADPYNPGFVKNVLTTTLIVPKAVWSKIAPDKITAETNMAPVGSGPYKLDKADQTQVSLVRDDAYWGKDVFGTPAMTTINHPIFKGNNDGDLKLESGEIDVSQQFTAQIWKMWEDKGKPVGTWLKEKPYYVPGQHPADHLQPDQEGPGQPEGPPGDRLLASTTPNIATTAMSDYSDAGQRLPDPARPAAESKYYDAAAVESEGWKYDTDKAVEILENELKAQEGLRRHLRAARRHQAGRLEGHHARPAGPTGTPRCEIVAKSAKAVGIDITTEFPQAPTL